MVALLSLSTASVDECWVSAAARYQKRRMWQSTSTRPSRRFTSRANSLEVIEHNDDIYGSGRADELLSIKTFYEQNFLAQGIPITYLAMRIDGSSALVEPEWDQEPFEQTYRTLTRS